MAATDDAEVVETTDRTEITEFTGELISVGPRFVQLDEDTWVNVDHVTAIETNPSGGTRVALGGGHAVIIDEAPFVVVAMLTASGEGDDE